MVRFAYTALATAVHSGMIVGWRIAATMTAGLGAKDQARSVHLTSRGQLASI